MNIVSSKQCKHWTAVLIHSNPLTPEFLW